MTRIINGIDTSRHQGDIDHDRVVQEGDTGLWIHRATMGATGVDDRYIHNRNRARWAGVDADATYHYNVTGLSAQAQLENILRVTGGDFGRVLPTSPWYGLFPDNLIILDCERTAAEKQKMVQGWVFPKADYTWELRALAGGLLSYTANVYIYTSREEARNIFLMGDLISDFPLDVAHYTTAAAPVLPHTHLDWEGWQHSSTGRKPGIAGNVDLQRWKIPDPPVIPDTIGLLASEIKALALATRAELG